MQPCLATHYSIGEDLHFTFLAAAPNPFTVFQGVKPISLLTGLLPLSWLEDWAVGGALLEASQTCASSSAVCCQCQLPQQQQGPQPSAR